MSRAEASRAGFRLAATLAGMGLLASCSVPADSASRPDLVRAAPGFFQRVREVVPALMTRHHVPGVSIAVILDRRLCWHEEFGVLAAGGEEPVTEDTVFEACSMSKPLFSYVVMQLSEQGLLGLDRPLDSYLPAPYLPDQPDAALITARMVMNHTTGLPNWRKGGWRKGGPLRLVAKPGSKFTYSGEGFTYLQTVVEQLTGVPVNSLVRERLLRAIGMELSSYRWEKRFERNWARGHDKAGKPKGRPHYQRANVAYSLYTTPCEYARYLLTMLEAGPAGHHRLRSATIRSMLSREVPCAENTYKGLGWGIKARPGGEYGFHGGANGAGFRCFSRFDRARGTGLVIMTNSDSGKRLYRRVLLLWDEFLGRADQGREDMVALPG